MYEQNKQPQNVALILYVVGRYTKGNLNKYELQKNATTINQTKIAQNKQRIHYKF